jgi:hypothetical protein
MVPTHDPTTITARRPPGDAASVNHTRCEQDVYRSPVWFVAEIQTQLVVRPFEAVRLRVLHRRTDVAERVDHRVDLGVVIRVGAVHPPSRPARPPAAHDQRAAFSNDPAKSAEDVDALLAPLGDDPLAIQAVHLRTIAVALVAVLPRPHVDATACVVRFQLLSLYML